MFSHVNGNAHCRAASRRAGSKSRRSETCRSAAASSATDSVSSITTPASGPTASAPPVVLAVMTGRPLARASTKTSAQASYRDGKTKQSDARMRCARSVLKSRKCTRFARPSSSARAGHGLPATRPATARWTSGTETSALRTPSRFLRPVLISPANSARKTPSGSPSNERSSCPGKNSVGSTPFRTTPTLLSGIPQSVVSSCRIVDDAPITRRASRNALRSPQPFSVV